MMIIIIIIIRGYDGCEWSEAGWAIWWGIWWVPHWLGSNPVGCERVVSVILVCLLCFAAMVLHGAHESLTDVHIWASTWQPLPLPPPKVRTKKREEHFPSTDKRRLVKWVWMRWVCFRLTDFVLHVWYDRVLYFGDFETSLYGIYIFLSCLDTYRCYRSSVISGALGRRDKLATKGERHSCMCFEFASQLFWGFWMISQCCGGLNGSMASILTSMDAVILILQTRRQAISVRYLTEWTLQFFNLLSALFWQFFFI